MEEKYIDLLLKRCLSVEASKILFVDYNTVNKGIADKVFARAKEIGYEEIYLCESDDFKEHDILKNISYDDIEKHPYFDASIWNEYALKGINKSNNHIDFMIVTNDLDIIADTKDGKKLIFKKGHFNI